MNRNKFIINVTVIGIVLIIIIPTTYTIIKNYNNRLITVTTKRIIEAAEKCVKEEKCDNKEITLKELYEKKYLKKESNPITKEYYNENSYIKVENKEYKFIIVK